MDLNLDRDLLLRLALVLAVCFFAALIIRIILHFLVVRLERLTDTTGMRWDDMIPAVLRKTKTWVIFFWLLSLSKPLLSLSAGAGRFLHVVIVFATGFQVAAWGFAAVNCWRRDFLKSKALEVPGANLDRSSEAAISLLGTALQGLLIILVVLFALSNLGVDIMAMVAGLGVGGIAVALAAQNILGDLLASLSIVLDKPFVIGDFIVVGDLSGTVENIGVKTTRVRSISGEQLIFSNKDLLENRIKNFQRMSERRVVQKVGVSYSTPLEQLREIPKWIQKFIEEDPLMRFDRCHLAAYGNSSLDFEFVFFILSSEYNVFMDHQQQLLLAILEKFAEQNVSIAFPSESLYIEKWPELPGRA